MTVGYLEDPRRHQVGTHIDPMHDGGIQVSNHAISKVAIFTEPISQRGESSIPSQPY